MKTISRILFCLISTFFFLTIIISNTYAQWNYQQLTKTCTTLGGGPYHTKEECEAANAQKWYFSDTTKTCTTFPSSKGPYDTKEACEAANKQNWYFSDTTKTCTTFPSSKGPYSTKEECEKANIQKWYFSDTTKTCTTFPSSKGPYSTKEECEAANIQKGSPGLNPCATYAPNPSDPSKTVITSVSCPTAIGKISADPQEFASKILGIATGLAGGIALIIMVIGSIRVLTSTGDQQKLAGGRDMIVAAVAGLLFLIFSVLILRFIGVTIFNLL